jgi:hypothetical protein
MIVTGRAAMLGPEQLASSRFFFHLVSDAEMIRDEDGVTLSLHDSVLLCAARAIEDLRQEGFLAAGEWQGWQIEIADCTGQTILRIPLGNSNVGRCPLAIH